MKYFKLLFFCSFLILASCAKKQQKNFTEADINIIPKPAEMQLKKGTFNFNKNTVFVTKDKKQEKLSTLLTDKFKLAAGFQPKVVQKAPQSNFVTFTEDKNLGKEAYHLSISKDSIQIKASGFSGFLYGLETIRQLLPPAIEANKQTDTSWQVPALKIKDEPRFQWRGLMLDVARHFFKKEYVLKTIDRLALLKMNTLHLHLVDDQGWRIQIKKYPKLTEVGAFRVDQEDKPWNARSKNKPGEKATYGGFYTQDDIREIVAHAKERGITVVPEIEMPAHVMSAIAAYPWLSCSDKPIAVPSGGVWPITDIYCPGKESTFTFLENVLTEVMALFPSKYIHVGGDEATKTEWKKSPSCQKLMKKEGLSNVDELQSYFMKRIEKFVNKHGRTIIGWDEILEGGLAPNAAVMSWRGIHGAWKASKQGHDVVLSPGTPLYFNMYQGDPDTEPMAQGGYNLLKHVYNFHPVVDSMSVAQKNHVLGAQANLFSEYITTDSHSEYMLFPRLGALSEILWTPKKELNWADFSRRIQAMFKRFKTMGINYSKSAYAVTAAAKINMQKQSIQLSLNNEFPNTEIRYALDGKKLNKSSEKYSQPLVLKKTTQLKAAVFKDGKAAGDTLVKTFRFHKAVGKKVSYTPMYSKQYQGVGKETVVNVLRGSKNFHDGQWLAWLVDDAEMTIDLGKTEKINSVAVGSMVNQGSGIYFPTKVEVLLSKDGKHFKKAGKITKKYKINGYVQLKDFKVEFDPQKARFVKVKVTNLGHPPSGGDAWLFIDEIVVE